MEYVTATLLILFWYLTRLKVSFGRSLPGISVEIISLWFAAAYSISETTQFLTIDETGLTAALASDGKFILMQWMAVTFHTTPAILLPIAKLASWRGISLEDSIQILKALHWLLSASILAAIAHYCAASIDSPCAELRARAESIFLAMLLLLPIDQLALKVFNYDAVALFGGVLAVLLVAKALQSNNKRLGYFAVIVATLAAAEKISSSPLLLLTLMGNALLAARTSNAAPWTHAVRVLLYSISASIACSLLLGLLYAACTSNDLPEGYWTTTLAPISSWLVLPAIFLFKSSNPYDHLAIFSVVTIFTLILAVILLVYFDNQKLFAELQARSRSLNLYPVLAAIFVVGAVGVYSVHPYYAPMLASNIPRLQNSFAFNGLVLHFGASNLPQHYLEYVIYSATIFVCAIPSALWLGLVLGYRSRKVQGSIPGLGFLVLVGLLLTLVAIINGVPILSRYLGVAILPIYLYLAAPLISHIAAARTTAGRALALTFCVAFIMEILPFAPLSATFRPFWANYPDPVPRPGVLNPSWTGWGEELMQAGKELVARCVASPDHRLADVPCEQLRIHTLYPGGWVHPTIQADTQPKFPNPALSTDADYYVLNRSAATQHYVDFPTIDPEFTIDARGYPMAWVYRGDRLMLATSR
ncbi:hypothetical protein [Rudaea cellulosilytica]|uniref:hypothetical protein n=1 Tax=Rudaea cellulosilytica TaxID=540746 RepID=UPI00036152C3|nr:hypothetical protein [Rudaea cellulosilytica]